MKKIILMVGLFSMALTASGAQSLVSVQNSKIIIKSRMHDGELYRSFQLCKSESQCQNLGSASEYPVSWLKESAHEQYVKIVTSSLKDVGYAGAALVAGYFTLGGIYIAGGVLTEAGGAIVAGTATAAVTPFFKELNPKAHYEAARDIETFGVQGNSITLKNNSEVEKVASYLDWTLKGYKH